MQTETFESWALVELFGHNRIAGKCSEQNVAGTNFLRVDVPETKSNPSFTRLLGHAAIYAINPVTEEVARALADNINAQPIESWDIRKYSEKLQLMIAEKQAERAQETEGEEEEDEKEYHQ